jgi:hypothetical protein
MNLDRASLTPATARQTRAPAEARPRRHDKPGDADESTRPLLQAMPLLALLFATSALAAAAAMSRPSTWPRRPAGRQPTTWLARRSLPKPPAPRRANWQAGERPDRRRPEDGQVLQQRQSTERWHAHLSRLRQGQPDRRLANALGTDPRVCDRRRSPSCSASFRRSLGVASLACCRRRKRARRPKTRP